MPIYKNSNVLYVATSNPTNIEATDAIRFATKLNIETVIVEHNKLEKLIEQNFTEESTFDFDDDFDLDVDVDTTDPTKEEDEKDKGEEAPIVKYINKLLIDAIRMGHQIYILNLMKNVSGTLSCRWRFTPDCNTAATTSKPFSVTFKSYVADGHF